MDEIIMPEVNIPEEDLQRMKEALDVVAEQIKVVHLAFHAKKKRTRKKNRNRLLKEFLRIMTLEGVKNDT